MIIQTEYGKVRGSSWHGTIAFRGIPYAKAPAGADRFKRPQRHPGWEGVFDATNWGRQCIQRVQEKGSFYQKEFYDNKEFSADSGEDCLNLNIYLPEDIESINEDGKGLPVAIYVHGGAFMGGAGSNLPFVPTAIVHEGVILVTINYRLGVWGFLAHPLVSEIFGEKSCGNLGLWDQIFAIRWIKNNIAAFGGDPDNITLFAQSAGAMSLQILALSDETEGLYSKMILQSGGGYLNPLASFKTPEEGKEVGDWLIKEICKSKGFDPKDSRALGEYLQTGDAKEIHEIAGEVVGRSFREGKSFCFVPVIDGQILKEDGNEMIRKGLFRKTPYILGANKNDLTMENAVDFSAENNSMEKANIEYAHIANSLGADSYVYYFEHQLPGDDAGAFHSAELWYVFGALDFCWRKQLFSKEDYDISMKMVKYWTNFMKSGKPDGEGLPVWEKCTAEDSFIMNF